MNKTVLKNFAAHARERLRTGIEQKAFELGITEKGIQELEVIQGSLIVGDRVLGERETNQYNHLKRRIENEGYQTIIAEATYTWFNRIIALRFMEVNDYLPIRSRVLSSVVNGKTEPDVLTNVLQYMDALNLDKEFVYRLREENRSEDLYHYVLVQQCNKLGEIIPTVFETISDDLALLLPDGLLQESSPIRDVVSMIDEEDWKNVEILGWLYQFYIADQKDTVFANLKKNKKIGKADIPAATQLFTPRWIVEYMVDNSLGRLWLEAYPDQDFEESLTYYLEDAEQEQAVQVQLDALKQKNLDIESIRFLDPCCGSGHILVYAFEVFYKMYQARGYSKREVPVLILENNLFGLEIDKRAAQLATFAVIMKAREYDARLFSRIYNVNVHSIEESNELPKEHLEVFAQGDSSLIDEVESLVTVFHDAKIYGSIIQVPDIQVEVIQEKIDYFHTEGELDIFTGEMIEYSLPLIQSMVNQYHLLAMSYEVVVTNPPYMGSKGMDPKLSKYVGSHYPNSKSDLFAVMMERMESFSSCDGFIANVTMQSWMFLSSYEKFRIELLQNYSIVSMAHLDNMVMGIAFGTAATILRKKINYYKSKFQFIKLKDLEEDTPKSFPIINERYSIQNENNFEYIPGSPIAYWASSNIFKAFKNGSLMNSILEPRQGLATADNNRFLRLWHEVYFERIKFDSKSIKQSVQSRKKWFPYNKGGERRQWYGNYDYVVNWEDDGKEIRNFKDNNGKLRSRPQNSDFYFRESITWSLITSGGFSIRYRESGSIHDVAGMSAFSTNPQKLKYILGLMSTKIANHIFKMLNPTLNLQVGDFNNFPVLDSDNKKVLSIVDESVEISKIYWNLFEQAWDFKKHPFLNYPSERIADSFRQWEVFADQQFRQLKANEEELNRIFIDIYGLQDELTPEVEEKDITIRRADYERDIRSFLSYLIGVIFGRYSLDKEGLAYAGGDWQPEYYQTYQPDSNNILPITDDGLFSDDLARKVVELIKQIYGNDTLEVNLLFIAEALGKKVNERPKETIRRYFQKDFYKDHLKIYQKRPIYWMFSSGRRGAFKALVYLHRYDRDTVARIRTDYVLPLFMTLDNLIVLEQQVVDNPDASNTSKAAARKAIENYQKDKEELSVYSEVLDHIAKQRIELDLDDGVKVNYAKFQDIELMASKTAKKAKMNLLEKI